MELKEMKEKSKEELQEHVKQLKGDINKTVQEILKGNEKNVKKARLLRKELARAKTLIAQKLKESNNG